MDVKNAVRIALQYAVDLFQSEEIPISNLALEEVESVEEGWDVTVGFSRPWDYQNSNPVLQQFAAQPHPQREYKVIRVESPSGHVKSVKIRETCA